MSKKRKSFQLEKVNTFLGLFIIFSSIVWFCLVIAMFGEIEADADVVLAFKTLTMVLLPVILYGVGKPVLSGFLRKTFSRKALSEQAMKDFVCQKYNAQTKYHTKLRFRDYFLLNFTYKDTEVAFDHLHGVKKLDHLHELKMPDHMDEKLLSEEPLLSAIYTDTHSSWTLLIEKRITVAKDKKDTQGEIIHRKPGELMELSNDYLREKYESLRFKTNYQGQAYDFLRRDDVYEILKRYYEFRWFRDMGCPVKIIDGVVYIMFVENGIEYINIAKCMDYFPQFVDDLITLRKYAG